MMAEAMIHHLKPDVYLWSRSRRPSPENSSKTICYITYSRQFEPCDMSSMFILDNHEIL